MSDPSHHVEIHLDARHPGEQRVVLNGEDLTEGLASFTLHANSRDKLPFLQLEPLVITGVVAANVAAPVLAMADATRAALVAGGWTPPADPDTDPGLPLSALFDNQPTEPIQAGSCHACRQPIDHAELHTTITRQIEHQAAGEHLVVDGWLVAEYHEQCAPAAGR